MQVILQILCGAAALYAVVVGYLYFGQRSLMYHPEGPAGPPAAADLPQAEEIQVKTRDGLSLLSWYVAPQQGQPVILYFHGNAGTIADRAYKARIFAAQGFGVLLAEYRAYGGNAGTPSERGLYEDARANLSWLAGKGVQAKDVVIYGESLGTGVGVQLAYEAAREGAPVRAVVLEAPFTSMPDAAGYHYPWAPVGLLTKDRFETKQKIAEIGAPLLVIHGERDATVPQDHGRRLFDLAKDPKQAAWLPSAGHADLFDHGAGEAAISFISSIPAKDG